MIEFDKMFGKPVEVSSKPALVVSIDKSPGQGNISALVKWGADENQIAYYPLPNGHSIKEGEEVLIVSKKYWQGNYIVESFIAVAN